MKIMLLFCLLSIFAHTISSEVINPEIVIRNVDRQIDVSSQLAKIICKLTVENAGKSPVKSVLYAVEPQFKQLVSFIGAQLSDASKTPLKVIATQVQDQASKGFWVIQLKDNLQAGKTVTVEVESVLTHALAPYPATITQKEKQLVLYKGNHYFYSPYKVGKQTTTVTVGTRNIESYSKLNPVSQSDNGFTYGPYTDQKPFAEDEMVLHYENNLPFLVVTRLERTLEVSHWGNIAVEEVVDVVHTGASLKGPFSRYEYQREAQSGISSVKSFKTVLPAAATDVYYRDEIGNISTSHMRVLSDSVELDLRPRFPLFGGWKTHYVLGYNVPSYEYLFYLGDNYKLKMRLVDHVFDDMVVEELITKVILPEGSHNLQLETPYPVQRLPDYLHYTYLDTKGRPVVSVRKTNVVENHIQDFELNYVFPRILMLQEPLLVVVFFYILFIFVVIYVRLDFSISKDETSENKMRVSGLCDKIILIQEKRRAIYSSFNDLLQKLKTNKEVPSFLSAVKALNQEHKTETAHMTELLAKLKVDAPELAERVSELQKLDKQLKEYHTQQQTFYTEKVIPGKVGRNQFAEAESAINKKKEECFDKICQILKTLH
ncbi:dolichyl-diphosphooligosaccharide--protein glycosyltransferase subunit 1 [Macrosteles quadrilineatus]|uniref:dolichyl-diphosphooligosaccharide--protein glycosyltransferase subunit 1 n=1 Tax=Macrosteles quadrilineatus TaxID=74068 RepID=UPI0023E2C752|nr:dolichyl-diphosphooligosaccharide--protein glycosyltransferase subunit 1 [Macrosteles quadrilineatus]